MIKEWVSPTFGAQIFCKDKHLRISDINLKNDN